MFNVNTPLYSKLSTSLKHNLTFPCLVILHNTFAFRHVEGKLINQPTNNNNSPLHSVPEIHSHAEGMLSNQQITTALTLQ